MPKALAIAISLIALAIVLPDCGGSSTSPSPSPSVSFSPDPTITAATVEVTVQGTPRPFVTVEISTPESSASPRPGTPFASEETGSLGKAKFTHLNPNVVYCWLATIQKPAPFTTSTCVNWTVWQYDTITLGT